MQKGLGVADALAHALKQDPYPSLRQVILLSNDGQFAAHTGKDVDGSAAQILGPGFAVAGNMLANDDVVDAMAKAYLEAKTSKVSFDRRLLLTLQAGYRAGGDKRGMQSVCLQVHGREPYAEIDLRVDSDPAALDRLEGLLAEYPTVSLPPDPGGAGDVEESWGEVGASSG